MMNGFKFKLESLLSQRKFVEDGLQREFVCLSQQVSEAKQVERQLEERQKHLAEELKLNLQEPKPVSENRLYVNYLSCLSERLGKQRIKVQTVESQKREKKVALLEAVKKRKMLERLKETYVHKHQRFLLKNEKDISDEIGVQQYLRKRIL
jgi:flagellar FliJ protein